MCCKLAPVKFANLIQVTRIYNKNSRSQTKLFSPNPQIKACKRSEFMIKYLLRWEYLKTCQLLLKLAKKRDFSPLG